MPAKRRAQYGTGTRPAQRADGMWVARFEAGWTANGTRRRIPVSAKTEAACKVKLKERQREFAKGQSAGLDIRATVKSWSMTWLARHEKKVRPTTYTTDAGAVRRWIVPTLGHRRLTDLTPADLRALREAITTPDPPRFPNGRSTTTALHAHKTMLTMLKAAIVEGHNVPERVLLTPKPVRAVNDRTSIPLEQAWPMLEVISRRGDAPRWVSALLQGMRQGESLGLTWDAIDLKRGVLDVSWQLQDLKYIERGNPAAGFRVPDGFEARHLTGVYHLTRPKTSRGRRLIPLVEIMVDALTLARASWHPNPWGLVWTSETGHPIDDRDDRARWHEIQRQAGVAHPDGRPYHLHETRNTMISLLVQAGVDRAVIEALVGHARLVESYVHVENAQTRGALEGLASTLRLALPAGTGGHHGETHDEVTSVR